VGEDIRLSLLPAYPACRAGAILYFSLCSKQPDEISLPLSSFYQILVLIYSSLSRTRSQVVYTDAIQGFCSLWNLIVCFFYLLNGIEGGLPTMISQTSEAIKFGQVFNSAQDTSFWLVFFYGFFINLPKFRADQSYIQRYMGAKSLNDTRKTVLARQLALLLQFRCYFFSTVVRHFGCNYSQHTLPPITPRRRRVHFISSSSTDGH
jgi:Na+/proline symporter